MTGSTTPTTPVDAGGLVALLGEQEAMLRELDALSRRQRGLVEQGEMEALAALLEVRAGLIGRMSRNVAVIDAGRIGADAEAERALARIAALAGEVAARDAEDAHVLGARRDAIGRELAGLGRSRRAANAYAMPAPLPEPKFQDREA